MKAIQIVKSGKPEDMQLIELPIPDPANDQILVRVHAAGVNFADILMVQGLYPDAPPKPFVPGYEVSGIVEKTGKDINNMKTGDRVVGFTHFGGYAEYALCGESAVRKIDESLSFIDAASLPVNWLTAYQSIFNTGPVTSGYTAVIHSTAGGVGIAAVQLLKQAGCNVIGTVGSDAKIDFVKSLGCDYVVNYRTENFVDAVNKITGKRNVDIILNSAGPDSVKIDLKLLRTNGRVVLIGAASFSGLNKLSLIWKYARQFKLGLFHLIGNSHGVYGVNMLSIMKDRIDLCENAYYEILKMISSGKVKPVIDSTFPLEKAADAHKRIISRQSIGKVVLTCG